MPEKQEYRDFEVKVNPDYTLKVELGIWAQEHLAHKLVEVNKQLDMISKWLETASPEQKKKYEPSKINMMMSRSFLTYLLDLAGITDKELETLLNLPF